MRKNFVGGARMGEWTAFHVEKNSSFNVEEFFKQFYFYKENETFNSQLHKEREIFC